MSKFKHHFLHDLVAHRVHEVPDRLHRGRDHPGVGQLLGHVVQDEVGLGDQGIDLLVFSSRFGLFVCDLGQKSTENILEENMVDQS